MSGDRRNHLDTCALMRPENVKSNGVTRKGVKCTCAKARAARDARLAARRTTGSGDYVDFGVSMGNGNYVRVPGQVE